MPIQRITYSAATGIGGLIADGVAKILEGRDILSRVGGVLLSMNDGSDWSALEQELQVPTGKGSAFNQLVNNAANILTSSQEIEKLKRIYLG